MDRELHVDLVMRKIKSLNMRKVHNLWFFYKHTGQVLKQKAAHWCLRNFHSILAQFSHTLYVPPPPNQETKMSTYKYVGKSESQTHAVQTVSNRGKAMPYDTGYSVETDSKSDTKALLWYPKHLV